jgi:hypothetical protein
MSCFDLLTGADYGIEPGDLAAGLGDLLGNK